MGAGKFGGDRDLKEGQGRIWRLESVLADEKFLSSQESIL